ncbi:polycomb protein Sfmbt-like isoform X1 [Leguminivora glycinivorella]|uniref:polycomb protein Sfmbt-like isoform X1 n=2 Tax=Leguminivora glycinivorella TaxID=1035111 RepID=UPI002010BC67|nr:polycomb protein Sfmbt-like isoform X1 [Leguminivora glycinivorella]
MAYYNAGNELNATSAADIVDEDEIVDDLSIVPLDKDSFAICELCGRVGRRRQFYPRNNKFCSLRCHASRTRRKHCSWRFKLMEGAEHMAGLIPLEPLPQLQQWHATLNDIQAGPIKQPAAQIANSYEWKDELFGCDFLAAPVSLFKHAPLHEMWDNTFEGMKVEVKNTDCDNYSEKMNDFFWVATVLKVKGYMGLLRYEGFGSDDSKDFWVNLCCSEVHPVGWCATRGKPLIPPRSIEDKYTDWKKFLVKQLTGARTLPANFYTKLNDSLKSRFSIGSIMEVVDKNRISQVKVASVVEIIGKRLHVKYYDSSPEDNGFWCHEDSPLIHPVGWAFRVGHPLDAPQSYCQRVATGRFLPNDTTADMFYKYPTNEPPLFVEGMKLEAIDPLNLSAVCAATVMQILNEGYMMIRIDCYPADASGADWFCYHQRSPCIFPVGFALANNIPLVPPAGYTAEDFSWEEYLCACGGRAATRTLFAARGHLVSHGFVCGMRLECADLMDPRLVCVATVARVVADLLKVHFDGWGSEYDQWLWAHSTDMYPVGWCRAVAHRLEGPMQPPPRQARKPPPKNHRRRRRHHPPKAQPQPPNTNEDSSQNSDMGDTKSLSPPTSVTPHSEVSADVESRHGDMESRPDDMDSRPDESESRPEESRPDGETPEDMESRPDSEQRADDGESRQDDKMDVEEAATETSHERLSDETNQESMSIPTDASQDSSVHTGPVSPDTSSQSASDKLIPRLVDAGVPRDQLSSVEPENWTPADVARFLAVNDCQPYTDNFTHVTGSLLLQLSKDEIIELLEMKVGPSLKIFDLIQQLKCKIKQPQCRLNFK